MDDQLDGTEVPNIIVSQQWDQKFDLLDEIGADKRFYYFIPEFKSLPAQQRLKISFNLFALIFGPLYYCSKKLWFKAALISSFCFFLIVCFDIILKGFNLNISVFVSVILVNIICAKMATYDYYKYVTEGKEVWGSPSKLLAKKAIIITIFVISLFGSFFIEIGMYFHNIITYKLPVILNEAVTIANQYEQSKKDQILRDISGVWVRGSDGTTVAFDLAGKAKTITVGTNKMIAKVDSIHLGKDNNFVKIGFGNSELWTVFQAFDKNGNFTLKLITSNGVDDSLLFVQDL